MTESAGHLANTSDRLRAIEAGLVAAGLATCLHESPAGADLTATLRVPGQREIEVVIDEDGYTELRYWASLSATPAHAVTTLTAALAAIATVPDSSVLVALPGRTHGPIAGYDGAITQRAGASGMPGPQDRVAEHERSPDPARPQESDRPRETPSKSTDLQSRLDQLPVGHPSSPYRDDGSRKPAQPDLADYELPLPDELSPDPDQPHSRLSAEDKARTGTDGSWDWKGCKLTPERSRVADATLIRCRDAEGRDADGNYGDHGLTPAMRRIEGQLAHGHLAPDTEQNALKEPDRFKEKLAKLIIRYPNESADDLAAAIHDGIRYTFVSDTEHYVESFWDTSARLQDGGFELRVRTNTWESSEYKGVNTRWRDPDSGLLFEVQLHTYESLEAKELTHRAYERINDTRTPVEEIESLREHQKGVSARVPLPHGWEGIPDYRKEDS